MAKIIPVIFLLPTLIIQIPLSAVGKSLAPPPVPLTPSNALQISASGTAAPWIYEDKANLAGQINIEPSQTVVIPASINDNTNASIPFKILQIGGPIGLLTVVMILIYGLFFHKKNNWSCFIRRETPTVDETNYHCGIEFKCL